MLMPGFGAERSLSGASEPYQLAVGWVRQAAQQAIIPAWYCCIMRWSLPFRSGVAGCRGHNAWYPFAWSACVGEAIWNHLDATLVEGTCSALPECEGKIW